MSHSTPHGPSQDLPAIVLVHGAFADGSSWQAVIPILQRDGYRVTAVQNPLHSLGYDVRTTRRVLDAEPGPVVLVGHSYGGAVITAAAAGRPNVRALVYVAAYAPDAGETLAGLNARFAPPPLSSALVPGADGCFLTIDRARFHDVFCADLPAERAAVLAATQQPVARDAFGQAVEAPAWKHVPSWYVLARQDRAISPELQGFMAERAGAYTTELDASHVPLLSQPRAVARCIAQAARSVALSVPTRAS